MIEGHPSVVGSAANDLASEEAATVRFEQRRPRMRAAKSAIRQSEPRRTAVLSAPVFRSGSLFLNCGLIPFR